MATRCMLNQTDCGLGLGCGGKSFLECGGYSCSKQICLDSFSQYIQNNENSALEEWNYIDGEILSFQILGSGFGYLIPWNVLGSASLIASSRADAQNQKWTALVSAAMAPIYLALAGYMLKYSNYIKSFCSTHLVLPFVLVGTLSFEY